MQSPILRPIKCWTILLSDLVFLLVFESISNRIPEQKKGTGVRKLPLRYFSTETYLIKLSLWIMKHVEIAALELKGGLVSTLHLK